MAAYFLPAHHLACSAHEQQECLEELALHLDPLPIPIQLIVLEISVERSKPRTLAKSVTVE